MASTVDIVAQPVAFPEAKAREQVTQSLVERARSLLSTRNVVEGKLKYKPFYAFPVELRKRVFMGDDIVNEGRIIVDGLTDVSRPFTEESIEDEEVKVTPEQLIEPEVDADEALVTANSRRMQVEHRERGEMEMEETPSLVYKPVWLFELTTGDVRVVDATDGTVFSDLLLG